MTYVLKMTMYTTYSMAYFLIDLSRVKTHLNVNFVYSERK